MDIILCTRNEGGVVDMKVQTINHDRLMRRLYGAFFSFQAYPPLPSLSVSHSTTTARISPKKTKLSYISPLSSPFSIHYFSMPRACLTSPV